MFFERKVMVAYLLRKKFNAIFLNCLNNTGEYLEADCLSSNS